MTDKLSPRMRDNLREDGVPCGHAGCLSHVTHPCEGCGRIAGSYYRKPLAAEDELCPRCKTPMSMYCRNKICTPVEDESVYFAEGFVNNPNAFQCKECGAWQAPQENCASDK